MADKPKTGEKIIQIIEWNQHLLGLSSEGRVYRAIIPGDMRVSGKNFWQTCLDVLTTSYKDEK